MGMARVFAEFAETNFTAGQVIRFGNRLEERRGSHDGCRNSEHCRLNLCEQ
jgi:hypothetical protein